MNKEAGVKDAIKKVTEKAKGLMSKAKKKGSSDALSKVLKGSKGDLDKDVRQFLKNKEPAPKINPEFKEKTTKNGTRYLENKTLRTKFASFKNINNVG